MSTERPIPDKWLPMQTGWVAKVDYNYDESPIIFTVVDELARIDQFWDYWSRIAVALGFDPHNVKYIPQPEPLNPDLVRFMWANPLLCSSSKETHTDVMFTGPVQKAIYGIKYVGKNGTVVQDNVCQKCYDWYTQIGLVTDSRKLIQTL